MWGVEGQFESFPRYVILIFQCTAVEVNHRSWVVMKPRFLPKRSLCCTELS